MLKESIHSKEKTEEIFKATIEEHNPFFASRCLKESQTNNFQQKEKLKKFVDAYVESQTHWRNQIFQQFDRNVLSLQKFDIKDTLDMEKKGWISIGDLVRFINIGTGQFFRTRDFQLVYKRLITDQNGTVKVEEENDRKRIDYEQFSEKVFLV